MSKTIKHIHLGFEVGTGEPVSVPLAHTFVSGQTQVSGKTTTLQAIVARAGLPALAFVTKRGEQLDGRRIRPYLPREGHEAVHWRFVETIMASALGQRALKYERLQIINAAKGAYSLADVRRNITQLHAKSKAGSPAAGIYELLGEYLDLVLPEMKALGASDELPLADGLNVMDLTAASPEMQALAIGAAIQEIGENRHDTLTVFPEAWQFAPRDRNTAAKFQAEKIARTGAAIGNFLLSDSQDIIGVSPVLRQASTVWIIGAQREQNELKRTLNVIKSSGVHAPKPAEIGTLQIGQFFVCHGSRAIKTYIQPAWMTEADAVAVACGGAAAVRPSALVDVIERLPEHPSNVPVVTEKRTESIREIIPPAPARIETQTEEEPEMASEDVKELKGMLQRVLDGQTKVRVPDHPPQTFPHPTQVERPNTPINEDAMYQRFKERLLREMPSIASGVTFTVTPPEKLRKDFQREEAARIVASAGQLRPLPKRVMKLVETTADFISQNSIAQRLGRSTGGQSWMDLGKAVKELASLGFVEIKERVGVRTSLRSKISADLAFYQATDADVEAVYQQVLYQLATDGDPKEQ